MLQPRDELTERERREADDLGLEAAGRAHDDATAAEGGGEEEEEAAAAERAERERREEANADAYAESLVAAQLAAERVDDACASVDEHVAAQQVRGSTKRTNAVARCDDDGLKAAAARGSQKGKIE